MPDVSKSEKDSLILKIFSTGIVKVAGLIWPHHPLSPYRYGCKQHMPNMPYDMDRVPFYLYQYVLWEL